MRIDKLTLAALEAVLMEYIDEDKAKRDIPTLRMLLQDKEGIRLRAKKITAVLKRHVKNAEISMKEDSSQAGGGSLPEISFPTFVVTVRPKNISVNDLEERLRKGEPPVVARIKEDSLTLDARTISSKEIVSLAHCVKAALG